MSRRIGRPEKRLEDLPLLRGTAKFAGDISFPGQLHMRVARAPVARGRVLGIDTDDAARMPGVAAVWTAADTAGIPPIDFRQVRVGGLEPYRQPILAERDVRYVGEPIAAVFAEDAYLAEDAAELVAARIEVLPPTVRSTDPLGTFGPGLTTEAAVIEKGCGDVDGAFDRAAQIVSLELEVGRHTGAPLETRGGVATWDAEKDLLEVYGASKIPHLNRLALIALLDLKPENLHLYESHVGGGFGVRGELYPEDVLLCLAARRLKRPIKWIEDRLEHLIAANHSRDQVHSIRAAVDETGFVTAVDCEFWVDQGAYVRTHAATVSDLTAAFLPGPYLYPAYRARGHIRLTNKTPAGTYRAPGRYESTFVRERLMDAVAHRLSMDPLDVRRLNFVPVDRMPFARGLDAIGTEVEYDSGDYARLLDKTLDAIDYDAIRKRLSERRATGELVGAGAAFFVEKSGLGPSDTVRLEMDASGVLEIVTGAASVGQGVETALAQVCADALGTDLSGSRVVHGRTDRIDHGLGAFASRVTVMTGSAVHVAAVKMREKLIQIAAGLLQLQAEALDIQDGVVRMSGTSAGPSASLAEVARHHYATCDRPLSVEGTFEADHMAYPYGVHVAVVRIDPETAGIDIERFFVGYDVGTAVNPMLVEGQLVGGAAQGIGGALYERFVYDSSGQPLAATFMDYLIPTVGEIPEIEAFVTEDAPSPLNPLGVKGAGEGGINAAGAAIAAAVDDAIGMPGAVACLPVAPDLVRRTLASRDSCATAD